MMLTVVLNIQKFSVIELLEPVDQRAQRFLPVLQLFNFQHTILQFYTSLVR